MYLDTSDTPGFVFAVKYNIRSESDGYGDLINHSLIWSIRKSATFALITSKLIIFIHTLHEIQYHQSHTSLSIKNPKP